MLPRKKFQKHLNAFSEVPQYFSGTFVCEEICNSFFLLHLKNFYVLQNKIWEAVDSVMFSFFLFCLVFFLCCTAVLLADLKNITNPRLSAKQALKCNPAHSPHLLCKFPISQVLLTAHPTVYPVSPSVPWRNILISMISRLTDFCMFLLVPCA